ncbi:hypothetical protein LTR62_001843 [Meristemomyces frigidus]|uniref:Trafficking protein particle complex subunit 10 n=1 Tax=Meristemomyces frigidus TaxID=1508187 RepID=A0AAN7YQI5_9PEZI|nr:hypothetical protein LTR62_001843 [Meristemomyces frigidus]
MEASSSSSKVTVEYHDPSAVFPLVSRSIAERLPLRNLNWQSPSRPLRQIRQLHVEFVPDKAAKTELRPPTQRLDSSGPTSLDIVRGGRDDRTVTKERRHQIPGLKTSPYLKIYVLRCDDKDKYKESSRNAIRDWIKENARTEGKRGEEHDAFEWMILHVVIPDTIAAGEPRWRESAKEPDELKERKTSNIKIPGKSKGTVFDRLRADFNESSKSGQDRVSQIRLQKSDVPRDLLPTPAVATTLEETPQERELAWKDLMDKFKVMLLVPFDTRVRKYEADIAEQEARRSLPGWNFNTFFIHKEGLAKALESIGLVEDALAIYDELLFGLETAVRDLASGQADGTATSFAVCTDDIEARILDTKVEGANGTHDDHASRTYSRLLEKDYRAKIVRSDISVFDFFSYMFSRQQALILRLANTHAARAEMGASSLKEGGEDLVLMSEVCWRASAFIHNNSRTLRQDLLARYESLGQTIAPASLEALVSSWMYAVADHILRETSGPALAAAQLDGQSQQANGNPHKARRSEFDFATGANPYPQRHSSIMAGKRLTSESKRPTSVSATLGRESIGSPPPATRESVDVVAGVPGLPELANYRGELFIMQRRVLEQLAEKRGWRAGWADVKAADAREREAVVDIDLDDEADSEQTNGHVATTERRLASGEKSKTSSDQRPSDAVLSTTLTTLLDSEDSFRSAYERLSEQAMRYYALATQTKSVEALVGDLAMLKRQQGDLVSAEALFKHLCAGYETVGEGGVGRILSEREVRVMAFYADVLRKLGGDLRLGEEVRVLMKCLGVVAGWRMDRKQDVSENFESRSFGGFLDDVGVLGVRISSAAERSTKLKDSLTFKAGHYFGEVALNCEIIHPESRDGFVLRVRFRSVFEEEFQLDQVSLRLQGSKDAKVEMLVGNKRPATVSPGIVEVELESEVTTVGPFLAERITFHAGNLRFIHDFARLETSFAEVNGDSDSTTTRPSAQPRSPPHVFVFPSERAFDCQVSLAKEILLDRPRHLLLALSSGQNDIKKMTIRLRPTSAGLRLHLGKATHDGIAQIETADQKSAGQIQLSTLAQDTVTMVKIPYTVEQATPFISMRLDVRYQTAQGSFTFLDTVTRRHELPLDVDVRDVVQLSTLHSSFTLTTTHRLPIVLARSMLRESKVYAVEDLFGSEQDAVMVHRKSGAVLSYKITRKEMTATTLSRREAALELCLSYVSTEELLTTMMRRGFEESLLRSGYAALTRVLLPLMVDRCRELFAGSDELALAVLLNSVSMPSYEEMGWSEVVVVLPALVRKAVGTWLHSWHAENTKLPLDYTSDVARILQRSITLSVEVPTIDMAFCATMKLGTASSRAGPNTLILRLGQPVTATVEVKHTATWSAASVLGEKKSKAATSGAQAFVLDIQADAETWLLGGPRRVHFIPSEDEDENKPKVFEIVLVPLKPGRHLLPVVEIVAESTGTGDQEGGTVASATCETFYESRGRRVDVVRDVRTTVVFVPGGRGVATEPG